jgi:hypothetical protein
MHPVLTNIPGSDWLHPQPRHSPPQFLSRLSSAMSLAAFL